MGMERSDRFFTVLLLVLFEEGLVACAKSGEVRAGVIHSDCGISSGFKEVRREGSICAHQFDFLQPLYFFYLPGDVPTRRNKDGIVDNIRFACGNLCQHGSHVGIGRSDRFLRGDSST